MPTKIKCNKAISDIQSWTQLLSERTSLCLYLGILWDVCYPSTSPKHARIGFAELLLGIHVCEYVCMVLCDLLAFHQGGIPCLRPCLR